MKRKWLISISCILLFLLITIGYATTIRFWTVGNAYDARMYREFAVEFEKETGIKVKVQPISWGQFYTKYLTAMAAGDPPDVATTNLGGPGDYGSVGGLVDLQAEFPNEVAELKQKIFDGPWYVFYFKNRLYGIPHGMTSLGVFYRKDIFAKLGIQPPRTWSELEEAIRILEANDYQFTFAWTRDSGWSIGQFCWPYGLETYTADGTQVTWQDERFKRGVKWACRLWNTHNMAMDKGLDLFISDEKGTSSPLMIDGLWLYYEIEKRAPALKGKWGVLPMPAADNGVSASVLGGTSWIIFRQSKHQAEAMKWIMFNNRLEYQQAAYIDNLKNRGEGSGLYLVPIKSFWDERIVELPTDDQDSLKKIMYSTRSWPYTIGAPESGRYLDNAFSRIRNNTRDYITLVAKKYKLSRWELHRAFAQGKYPDDRKKYLAYVDEQVDKEIERIVPLANEALTDRRADYAKFYANIVERIPELEKKANVMTYAKGISVGLILLCLILIVSFKRARKSWVSYLYITPTMLLLLIFLIIPIVISIYIAFTQYNPILPLSTAEWVGLKNFKTVLLGKQEVFTDSGFHQYFDFSKWKTFLGENDTWMSLWRSFKFAIIVIPLQLMIAVFFAVGLDKELRADRLFKFVYFSPLVTSVVSISLIWTVLYLGAKYGWINALLLWIGLTKDPVMFLQDSQTFLYAVIVMSIWHGLAFVILIYLAGLQNIPKEHYEAASIDGANFIQQFFRITLPSLRPQITFLTIIGTIGAMQVFEQIYMLGGGAGEAGSKFGPADSGMTIVCHIYRKGFEDFQMGEASAVAYILFGVIFILTFINWKMLRRQER
ncbi:MAG: extracellular solute-binding protein [bacterium]|nr:extracellular solute-binding protein [bacterium]